VKGRHERRAEPGTGARAGAQNGAQLGAEKSGRSDGAGRDEMNVALIHGPRDVRIGTRPMPRPAEDRLLLRVRAVGICGSDLHYYLEGGIGSAQVNEPTVIGHEFAAEVIDERANEFGFDRGQLVAVDPAESCGQCEFCLDGYPNLCPDVRFAGAPPFDGALAEYVTAKPQTLFKVPDSFDPATTALLEPLGVAIHALELARLKPMESVAVLGAGPIGLLLMQVAKRSGAGKVYVVDPLAYRTRLATELGADAVTNRVDAVTEWTAGRGVDVVLEATNSPRGPQDAVDAVRIGGRLVLVGVPEGDSFTLTASIARRKGLTIKMSRRMGHVYPAAIQMVEEGEVQLLPLVSHRFPLTGTPEAFALHSDYRDGVIKSVIELPSGGA